MSRSWRIFYEILINFEAQPNMPYYLNNNYTFNAQNKFMGYYNYHGIARKLIKNGHCLRAEIVKTHGKISPALVLYFTNHKPMPIREVHFDEYMVLLSYFEVPVLSINLLSPKR